MDPVSIAAAVGPALKTLYSVTTTLYTFITSAKKVGKSLEDLHGEVRGLTRVLEDIEAFPKDTVIAQTSYASSRTDGAWDPIHNAIQDTQRTIKALQKVLDRLGPPSEVTNGFKKAVKQVQLSINSEEISNIKSRVHWHSTILQMGLQTAALAIICRTNDNVLNVINPKIDTILPLVSKVEGLVKQVENLSSQWTTKDDKLPMGFRNPDIAGHTQQLKRTAEAVIASASTVIESQSTIVSGKDRQHPSSASSGELSEESKKCGIEEWITHLTVDHEGLRSESHSASELMPDDSVSSIGLNRRRRSQQTNEAGMPGSTSETGKDPGPPKRMDARRESSTKNFSEEKLTHPEPDEEIFGNSGASVNAKDCQGRTRLHCAAACWGYTWVVELLKAGASVNVKDNKVRTPLHDAAYWGYTGVVEVLLKAGANLEARDDSGYTPLIHAARWGHRTSIELLLAAGADKRARTNHGETVLHTALCYAHSQDCHKTLCGICAASVTRKDIAKLLCERGADPSAKRNDVTSVLSWLRKNHVHPKSEQKALIRVLKGYGAKG